MNRRNLLNVFASVPVLPWLTLKGIKSPCKIPVAKEVFVRVQMEDGSEKIFEFPMAKTATCEVPMEKE